MVKRVVYAVGLMTSLAFGGTLEDCKVYRQLGESEQDLLHQRLTTPLSPTSALGRTADFLDVSQEARLLNPSEIKDSGVKGANNGGVWEVRDRSGNTYALKVTRLRAFSFGAKEPTGKRLDAGPLKESLLIHQRLSELDMAPRLEGVLNKTQMQKLQTIYRNLHFDPINLSGEPSIGILMERIPDAWSTVHDPVPPWLKDWPVDRLRRAVIKIMEIEDTLDSLKVQADDPQLLISPNGRVVLGDLDRYRMQLPSDVNDLGFMGRELIAQWESATGRQAGFTLRTLVQER